MYPGADGASYNHFAIGQSVLALPFYGAGVALKAILPADWATMAAGPGGSISPVVRFGGTLDIVATSFYGPVSAALLVALFYLFERALGV